jgi:hypothetical protein
MRDWLFPKLSVLTGTLIVTSSLLACGNVDPADNMESTGGAAGASNIEPEGPLLPWAVGNNWTYQVTDTAGVVTEKTTTIGDEEEVGGEGPNASLLAFHVVTSKGAGGNDRTESWQAPSPDNPDRIVRYRELSYGAVTGNLELEEHWEPEKLHVDGSADRIVAGASWLESYSETKLPVGLAMTTHAVRERWTVVADDETLEVPAGTFDHVLHLQKAGGNATKEYWYVHGVGKLKETGTQTEELVDYVIEGQAP